MTTPPPAGPSERDPRLQTGQWAPPDAASSFVPQPVAPQAGPRAPAGPVYRLDDQQPKLPVVVTPYHHFFRTPSYRWWRSLLALLLAALGVVIVTVAVAAPVAIYEYTTGVRQVDELSQGRFTVTPLLFAANNVALALTIPVAMLTMWACFGMRPGWLSSVTGRLRWRLVLLCFAVCLVPYGALTALGLSQGIDGLHWGPWSIFMIVTILVTTPLQAAGEEYGLRGLYNRAVAAWVPNRLGGAVVGGLVSSVVFMLLHGAGDVWLNVFYFLIGAVACRLAYRTGGLEAPIALHAVNNLSAEATMPFIDISNAFDRSAGTADVVSLAPQLIVVALAWGLLELVAHVAKPVREAAPGAEAVVTRG